MKIRPNNNDKPPALSGQHKQIIALLKEAREPILSLKLQRKFPQCGARIHELRNMGFNIVSVRQKPLLWEGVRRVGCVSYVLGAPHWKGGK